MRTRDTVRYAWQLTQSHLKGLIWYAAVPSFFVIIVSSAYLGYQYNAFKTSALFSAETHDFMETARQLWGVLSDYPGLALTAVILALIVLAGYFVLPPLFRGVVITALNKIRNNESPKGSMESGIRHFFPMFEFGLLTTTFSVTTLFTESSFILRWWGEKALFVALPILLLIAIVGFVLSFLFTYAEYYIVLEDKAVIRSMIDSAILVGANLKRTFLVFVLMLLIGARIILNVILVLLIPMVVVAAATYFATLFFSTLGFLFIGLFVLIILLISAYLFGLFNLFAAAVWVLTFEGLIGKEVSTQAPAPSLFDEVEEE